MRRPWRIYAVPLALAAVSGFGLVAALLTEGAADLLWTLAVAVPVIVICAKLLRAR